MPQGHHRELNPQVNVELDEHVFEVRIDRVARQHENVGDLAVRHTVYDVAGNSLLGLGEPVPTSASVACCPRPSERSAPSCT